MATTTKCAICLADNQDEIEEQGLMALAGDLSWRKAALAAGTHPSGSGLRNHMQKHWQVAAEGELVDRLDLAIADTVALLYEDHARATSDQQALILVTIHNLQGLRKTKPSQSGIIVPVKTVHEIEQTKAGTNLLQAFADRKFNRAPVLSATPIPALPRG